MKKEDLLTLWNVKDWDKNNAGIYFTGKYGNKEVNFNFNGFTEKDMPLIPDDFMQRLFRELEKLDYNAHEVIQAVHPDEDASKLNLTEIIVDKSGCYKEFALGYDMGESPAGRLYILVKFDKQLRADKELIYETY
jgi:hypothetical protein